MKVSTNNKILDPESILRDELKVKAGDKLADLGCGLAGHFTIPAASLVTETGEIYAVDIVRAVLTSIEKQIKFNNIKNIKTRWSNLEIFGALKIHDGLLDHVLLANVLSPPNLLM